MSGRARAAGRRERPTHSQYEALRDYEDGRLSWRPFGHQRSLIRRGWIIEHYPGYYAITAAGRDALASYRERWGVR